MPHETSSLFIPERAYLENKILVDVDLSFCLSMLRSAYLDYLCDGSNVVL